MAEDVIRNVKRVLAKCTLYLLIEIGVIIFDMVSDIILALNYYNTSEDQSWFSWFGLTLTFFLLSGIPLFFLLLHTLYGYIRWGLNVTNKDMAKFFHIWKQFECVAESGPQLILQLYILAISSMDGDETSKTDSDDTPVDRIFSDESVYNDNGYKIFKDATVAPTDEISDEKKITFVLQILAILSAFFSISWSSVNLKKVDDDDEGEEVTKTDYGIEMIWNMLCVSSRVIVLVLLATMRYKHSFYIVTVFQVIIFFYFFRIMFYNSHYSMYDNGSYFRKFLCLLLFFMLGVNSLFNIFLPVMFYNNRLAYPIYVTYWFLMMVENSIVIGIWYHFTIGQGLWYHIPATIYVMAAYFISFIVKTFHTWIKEYNFKKPVKHWEC